MHRLVALLTILLLAPALLPGASADDVRIQAWERLLDRPAEVERPVLGLVCEGSNGNILFGELEPDPGERPSTGDEEDDDHVEWLLSWGHGGDVAAGLLRRIAVDVEVRDSSGRVERARLITAPGRRALHSRTQVLRAVTDYEVELACDNSGGLRPSALGNPQPATLLDGLALDVCAFVVGDGRIALEVVLQAGRFERPVARLDTQARFLGELDLPRYRGVLLSASGATQAGQALEVTLAGADGECYGVRLIPRVLDVPEPEDRARVHRLDAGLLITAWEEFRFARDANRFMNPRAQVLPALAWRDPPVDRSVLWEHIDHVLPETAMRLLPRGDVWLVAEEDAAARVRSAFDAWKAAAARTVRVEITARAGEDVIGRVDVPVLTGRTAFFRLGVDQTVLLDADVEVG